MKKIFFLAFGLTFGLQSVFATIITVTNNTDWATYMTNNSDEILSTDTIVIQAGVTITNLSNPVANNGTLINNGTLNIVSSGPITNNGVINNNSSGIIENTASFNNSSSGIINNAGTINGSIVNSGVIHNYGSFNSYGFSFFSNSGDIYNYSSGSINNDGLANNSGTINNSGNINNNGTINNNNGAIINICNGVITGTSVQGNSVLTAPCPPVPTMGQWGLLSFGLFLLILGVATIKQRASLLIT